MEEMLNSKQIRQIFNVTNQTLFNWRKSGKLPYVDIGSKGYLYKRSDVMNILGLKEEKANVKRKNVIYCRVSNTKQKEDLKTQEQTIVSYCNYNGIIPDKILLEVASGMNENREKFNELLDMVMNNEVDTVYVTYKDRLTRFGYEYFETIFKKFNTKIVVLNNVINERNFQQELTEDLISIIHHFSMKMYSNRRKQLNEIKKQLEQ